MKAPDPRTIFVISICFSTLGVLISTPWMLACVLIVLVLFDLAFGVRLLPILLKIKSFIIVVVFIVLLNSIFNGQGKSIVEIGGVVLLTEYGLISGLTLLLRMGMVIMSAALFTMTTSRRIIQGLIQLKIPYEFAFMASVALRFLPVFTQEFKDTVIAAQLRGFDFRHVPIKQKLWFGARIFTPVVFGAIDKAQKLSLSMELRAFRMYSKRTSRFELRFRTADYVYWIVAPLVTAMVLLYYYS